MKKNTYSTRRIDAAINDGNPSHYISHIDDWEAGDVIIYLRVSSPNQKDELTYKEAHLRRELEKLGFKVAAVYKEVVSGWAENRIELERAAMHAKAIGAIVVTEFGC